MKRASFPIEIFNLILDELAALDAADTTHSALRACSLVCRDFAHLSRPHLFSNINISFYFITGITVSPSRTRLVRILKENPEISSYVRSVSYTFKTELPQGKRPVSMPQSNFKDELSISLHTFFPKIHTLRVQDHTKNINLFSHSGLNPLTPLTLCEYIIEDFFGSPTISVLDFDLIDHAFSFPEIVLNFPSLRIWRARSILTLRKMWTNERQALMQPLKLQELCVGNIWGFAFPILRYCPDLVRLEMHCVDNPFFVLDAVPDSNRFNKEPVVVYKNLRTLTLDHSMIHFAVLLEAAEREGVDAMPALQSFTLEDPPTRRDEREALTMVLRHAPNLQTLVLLDLSARDGDMPSNLSRYIMRCRQTLQHFRVEYWRSQVIDYDSEGGFSKLNGPIIFPNVCDVLSSIRGKNGLKTLGMRFKFYPGHPRKWLKDFASIWERLDCLLAGNGGSGFPYLEKIELSTGVVHGRLSPTNVVSDDLLWDTWMGSLTLLCSTFSVKSEMELDTRSIKSYHLELLRAQSH